MTNDNITEAACYRWLRAAWLDGLNEYVTGGMQDAIGYAETDAEMDEAIRAELCKPENARFLQAARAGDGNQAGTVLVPATATDDMLIAGQEAWMCTDAHHPAMEDCKQAQAVWDAMLAAAPATSEPAAWQERQEVRPGVFGEWYDKPNGWSLTRPREIESGGIRYQFRPLYAAAPGAAQPNTNKD